MSPPVSRFYNQVRLEKVIAEYDEAIRLDPQDADAHYSRGLTYNDLGKPQRALQDLDQAIRIDPQDVWAYVQRAVAYIFLGRDEEASKDVLRIGELGFDHTPMEERIERIKAER